jgi:hypothetical protein
MDGQWSNPKVKKKSHQSEQSLTRTINIASVYATSVKWSMISHPAKMEVLFHSLQVASEMRLVPLSSNLPMYL